MSGGSTYSRPTTCNDTIHNTYIAIQFQIPIFRNASTILDCHDGKFTEKFSIWNSRPRDDKRTGCSLASFRHCEALELVFQVAVELFGRSRNVRQGAGRLIQSELTEKVTQSAVKSTPLRPFEKSKIPVFLFLQSRIAMPAPSSGPQTIYDKIWDA